MALWKVNMDGKYVHFGPVRRRRLTTNGCNEPFSDRYWCPRKKWFLREPCPFVNRRECDNYIKMTGSI